MINVSVNLNNLTNNLIKGFWTSIIIIAYYIKIKDRNYKFNGMCISQGLRKICLCQCQMTDFVCWPLGD